MYLSKAVGLVIYELVYVKLHETSVVIYNSEVVSSLPKGSGLTHMHDLPLVLIEANVEFIGR